MGSFSLQSGGGAAPSPTAESLLEFERDDKPNCPIETKALGQNAKAGFPEPAFASAACRLICCNCGGISP
jgi:hypothetical protein